MKKSKMDTHFLFSVCDKKWKMKLGVHFPFFIFHRKWKMENRCPFSIFYRAACNADAL